MCNHLEKFVFLKTSFQTFFGFIGRLTLKHSKNVVVVVVIVTECIAPFKMQLAEFDGR